MTIAINIIYLWLIEYFNLKFYVLVTIKYDNGHWNSHVVANWKLLSYRKLVIVTGGWSIEMLLIVRLPKWPWVGLRWLMGKSLGFFRRVPMSVRLGLLMGGGKVFLCCLIEFWIKLFSPWIHVRVLVDYDIVAL